MEGKLFKPLEKTGSREFEGILTAWDADTVTIEAEPVRTGKGRSKKKRSEQEEQGGAPECDKEIIRLPRKEIAVLRLYLDL